LFAGARRRGLALFGGGLDLLVFDSRLTNYPHLARLDQMGITFMTLRRRTASLLQEVADLPASAWRRATLDVPARKYKNPRSSDSIFPPDSIATVPLRLFAGKHAMSWTKRSGALHDAAKLGREAR
jgi:hypothetical protein